MIIDDRPFPLVLAPLAGGPSTPQLAATVTEAGGLGFLALGYLSAAASEEGLLATQALTSGPIGVNVFVPGSPYADQAELARFRDRLAADEAIDSPPGAPAYDDDAFEAKVELLTTRPVSVVSFTFGLPPSETIDALHTAGSEVWITVTTVPEAEQAVARGADALVVQGLEAGGHRGGLQDTPGQGHGLLAALQLIGERTDTPMIATGGISTGRGIAAVLACGARAAALGTAFLDCPEAGTSPVHRAALRGSAETTLTRAFTGRTARGIRNRFMQDYSDAPAAYPEVHHITSPIRQVARRAGREDLVNLWAGEGYQLTRAEPAADVVRRMAGEATVASRAAARLWADAATKREAPE
jgi:nitronate monooxygenase